VELVEGMLFVKLTKVESGWLWRNDRIDNKSEHVPDYYLSGFVVKRAKGRMMSTGGEEALIA
jgi:hypothetical protein